MNQIKKYISEQKKLKKESAKTKAKKFIANGGDITFGISKEDQEHLLKSINQALILKEHGEIISLCVPILEIDKFDLKTMMVEGHTCDALAKRVGKRVKKQPVSLADIHNHYGMVYLVTEEHKMVNVDLEVKEIKVEKEIIKIEKTNSKDILKAINNTTHKMSKTWQADAVKAILDEFLTQLKN